MSQHRKEDENFIGMVLIVLFKLLIGTIKLAAKAMILPILFLWKRPISRALNLERLSTSWPNSDFLYLTVKWIAAWGFFMMLGNAAIHFTAAPLDTNQIIPGVLQGFATLACALLFNSIHWIGLYARNPDIQKKIAGIAAERHVQKLIEKNMPRFPLARTLHGKLFVFNANLPNEFSVEADHIVITERNIFVIETKCRSGTISAVTDSPKWKVSSKHGDSEMQNALRQAKNTARVLHHQANLPCEIVPLVAIKGNDVKITDGPSNVVTAENIVEILRAFEQNNQSCALDPDLISNMLCRFVSEDQAAMARHIERAQAARIRSEQAEIVSAASI